MKKSHILLLILVAAAIAVIISTIGDVSTYETFASASKQPGKSFHVVGFLEKNLPMEYNPKVDPNKFQFFVKDKSGQVHKVVFSGSKPVDIEKSEQIVMTGYMNGNEFKCNKIQMKCPSKYQDKEVVVGI